MGRKSKAESRKHEILIYYNEIIKKEGFENTSIAKIAKIMDVNPSLLIHYFKTKEAIVIAFVEYWAEICEQEFKDRILESGSPRKGFEKALDVLFGQEWLDYFDQTVLYACYYLSARNKKVRERLQSMYKRFRRMLVPQIKKWMDNGIIRDEDSPEMVADFLIMNSEGLHYFDKLMDDPEGFKKRAAYMREMIFRSLAI